MRPPRMRVAALALLAACATPPEPVRGPSRPPPPPLPLFTPPPAPTPVVLAPTPAPDAGAAPPDPVSGRGLALSVEIVGVDRVAQGQPISIVVTLANGGPEPAALRELPDGLDYDVVLIDREGRTRPPTRFGRKRAASRAALSAAARTLRPGEVVRTSLLASRIADTSDHGRYQLTVVRRPDGVRAAMSSNEVVFEVR